LVAGAALNRGECLELSFQDHPQALGSAYEKRTQQDRSFRGRCGSGAPVISFIPSENNDEPPGRDGSICSGDRYRFVLERRATAPRRPAIDLKGHRSAREPAWRTVAASFNARFGLDILRDFSQRTRPSTSRLSSTTGMSTSLKPASTSRSFIPFGMINIPARMLHGIMAAAYVGADGVPPEV
jgi:hypothetical protein